MAVRSAAVAFFEITGPIIAVAGLIVIFVQVVIFLRSGQWLPLTLADARDYVGLGHPDFFGWVGIQIAFERLLGLPLGFGTLTTGLFLTVIAQELEKRSPPPADTDAT